MRPTFFGIEIARSGLAVSQKGLDVTGHNVANVDTAGYTRQRLVNTAVDPLNSTVRFKPVNGSLVGQGARIMILDQIRQGSLDRVYRTEVNQLAEWSSRTQGLTYIEALFEGTDDTDLMSLLQGLYDGFNELTKEGNDLAQRSNLISQATKLTTQLNHTYNRLIQQQKDQELAVRSTVTKINSMLDQIAELNNSIYKFERGDNPQPANDLRDKRNLLLDELSTLVDITYEETDDRQFHVYIDSYEVVGHKTVNHLQLQTNPTKPVDPSVPGGDTYSCSMPGLMIGGTFKPLNLDNIAGELKAHIDLRDSTDSDHPGIPYFIQQLNIFTQALAKTVNDQHKQGFTRPTDGHPSIDDQAFFEELFDSSGNPDYTQITAGNIKLDDNLLDPTYGTYYIAASSIVINTINTDATAKQSGNQENALALYQISDLTNIPVVGKLSEFGNSITYNVASTLEKSKERATLATALVLSADTSRTSVSGVSLDEEMTSLIRYQHAFTGASRVLTTMDDALDILINRMGRVGL